MNYPTINEYKEAILFAEDKLYQLNNLRPVLDDDGTLVMSSGNFAVVFKMKDEETGKLHALKCFTREQEGRAEAYRQIAEELEYVSSTFLTPIKYLDKEFIVDSDYTTETEFPVLLMDWVEGETLDKYIRKHLDDQYELSLLAYQFSRLAMWLMPQPFAHGDLKPDNILVKDDGTLVLVDYDGMYVPAMKGQKARELGSPDFRHPSRTETDFDEHIDDFSLASILLSLKAISLQPSLLEEYGASDRLLFSANDYRNLSESKALNALRPLMQDVELASLYSLFILAISQNNLSQVSFRLFNLSRPERPQYEEENLSTEVTEEDLANAWTDEFGVKYSKDGKRLLRAPDTIDKYSIKDGTIVICDTAFPNKTFEEEIWTWGGWDKRTSSKSYLKALIIPNSVKKIGGHSFAGCYNLNSISISNSLEEIGNGAFKGCHSLRSFIFPHSLKIIGDETFYDCRNLQTIFIPNSLEFIGSYAFKGCENVKTINVDKKNSIYDSRDNCNAIIETKSNTLIVGCASSVIPNGVVKIGDSAFWGCIVLKSLLIPEGVEEISIEAFWGCENLTSIHLPNSLIKIGDSAFSDCSNLESIDLPISLISIGDSVFSGCYSLESVKIPNNVISIGEDLFFCCFALRTCYMYDNIKWVGNEIFSECENLEYIHIPVGSKSRFESLLGRYVPIIDDINRVSEEDLANAWIDGNGVKYSFDKKKLLKAPKEINECQIIKGTIEICEHAFSECKSLQFVDLPDSVKEIGANAFEKCYSLREITIPNGVTKINYSAFKLCTSLHSIVIPNSVMFLGDYAFARCGELSEIIISNKIKDIRVGTFSGCSNLKSIIIPESVIDIEEFSFNECKQLESVYISDGITNIGDYSFYGCSSITNIRFPKGLKKIGHHAFEKCRSIVSCELPDGLSEIGNNSFQHCDSLFSMAIPQSVQNIGELAFNSCTSLASIDLPDSLTSINRYTFGGSGLKSVTIPNGVKTIGEYSFVGCESLTSISIPDDVEETEEYAFHGCIGLKSIWLRNSNIQIKYNVFDNCPNIERITIPLGTKGKYEGLLPDYKDILVEQ